MKRMPARTSTPLQSFGPFRGRTASTPHAVTLNSLTLLGNCITVIPMLVNGVLRCPFPSDIVVKSTSRWAAHCDFGCVARSCILLMRGGGYSKMGGKKDFVRQSCV